MVEVNFQLPVDGYETLTRILAGYARAKTGDSPVFLKDVEATTAMAKSQISRNNGFFVSTGILEREGKGFKLTAEGQKLALVLDHFKENIEAVEVQNAWREIVDRNDFLQRVTAAVRVRSSMESEAFARHIALTSGAPNKPQYMTGARTVITILKAANKLVEDSGEVLRAIEAGEIDQNVPADAQVREDTETVLPSVRRGDLITLASNAPLVAAITIAPTTTDDELIELARKVKLFARLLNERDE